MQAVAKSKLAGFLFIVFMLFPVLAFAGGADYLYDGSYQLIKSEADSGLGVKYTYDEVGNIQWITPLVKLSGIAAGDNHNAVLLDDGTILVWGGNLQGQLGTTSTQDDWIPERVKGLGGVSYLSGVAALDAGALHTVAVLKDGTVWAWGDNTSGQLGASTAPSDYSSTPVLVSGVDNVVAVAAGGAHTVALKADGTVWTWGDNTYGQLAQDPVSVSSSEIPMDTGITNAVYVAAGDAHTLVIKADGTVWAWGDNTSGQLGTDTSPATYSAQPLQVTNLQVLSVAAGDAYSVALKADGTVWAWGDNTYGQLGTAPGSLSGSITPVLVNNIDSVNFIAGGPNTVLAVRVDGTVWGWGGNASGQIGINNKTAQYAPVQTFGENGVGNIDNVSFLDTGATHTVALKSDGSLWVWGGNASGQLGDDPGSRTESLTPIELTIPAGVPDATAPVTSITPSGATYWTTQTISLSCDDGPDGTGCGGTFYCIGSDCYPTTVYTGPFELSSPSDIRFLSRDMVGNLEQINVETYVVNHTITATASAGGSLSPSGSVQVTYGSDQVFTLIPNSGYEVGNLRVDGISQGEISSYTFSSVVSEHAIDAVFYIPPDLNIGVLDSGQYGYNFGSSENYSVFATTFQGDGEDKLLHVQSYDVDYPDEIGLYLNGTLVGYLSGADGADGPDSIWWLPSDILLAGENRIEFRNAYPGDTWGVQRIGIYNAGASFGNMTGSGSDSSHADGFELHIQGSDSRLLEVSGWDSSSDGEIAIALNGTALGGLPAGSSHEWTGWFQLILNNEQLIDGDNVLVIYNSIGSSKKWGIKLNALRPIDAEMGHVAGGNETTVNAVTYLFPIGASDPGFMELLFNDISYDGEVEVSKNGSFIYNAPLTATWGMPSVLDFNANQMARIDVVNTENTNNSPPVPLEWGVKINKCSTKDSDGDRVPDIFDSDPNDPAEMGLLLTLVDGEIDPTTYGNGAGTTDSYNTLLTAKFINDGQDKLIHVRGYFPSQYSYISIQINGQTLGYLTSSPGTYGPDSIWWIPVDMQIPGENKISFYSTSTYYGWGIDRLGIFSPGAELGNLTGLPGGDTSHADGFELHIQNADERLLELSGWDSSSNDEISLALNGYNMGGLPQGNPHEWTDWYQIYLFDDYLGTGDNILMIKNASGGSNEWGVKLNALRPVDAEFGYSGDVAGTTNSAVHYLLPLFEDIHLGILFNSISYDGEAEIYVDGAYSGNAPVTDSWKDATVNLVQKWPGLMTQLDAVNTNNSSGAGQLQEWQVKLGGKSIIDDDGDGVANNIDSDPNDPQNKGLVVRLPENSLDSGSYGNASGYYTVVAATFMGNGNDRLLHVFNTGSGNVLVFVNGKFYGNLTGHSIWWLSSADLNPDLNRVEFVLDNPGESWTIEKLGIYDLGASIGDNSIADMSSFGGFDIHFQGPDSKLLDLNFWSDGVFETFTVNVNGHFLGDYTDSSLPVQDWSNSLNLYLQSPYIYPEDNILKFTGYNYAIRLNKLEPPDVELGNLGAPNNDTDEVTYMVPFDIRDGLFSLEFYDVDSTGELEEYVENSLLQSVPATGNDVWGSPTNITLQSTSIKKVQIKNMISSSEPWGVRISESLVEPDTDGDGVVDSLDIDPDDPNLWGWVLQAYINEVYNNPAYTALGTCSNSGYDDRIAMVFMNDGTDKFLHVQGFAIDSSDEVGVYLNDQLLGYLTPYGGANINCSSPSEKSLWLLPVGMQQPGLNRIEFRQKTPGAEWGVKDIGIFNPGFIIPPDVDMELHIPGNKGRLIEMRAWDNPSEQTNQYGHVKIDINGKNAAYFPVSNPSEWTQYHQLYVPSSYLVNSDNISHIYLSNYTTSLEINAVRDSDTALGYFGGASGTTDTIISYLVPMEPEDGKLSLEFYDVDTPGKVELSVDGGTQTDVDLTGNDSWGAITNTVVPIKERTWAGFTFANIVVENTLGYPETWGARIAEPLVEPDSDGDGVADSMDSDPNDPNESSKVIGLPDNLYRNGIFNDGTTVISALFQGNGHDRILHVAGYDISVANEVCTYLNGTQLGCFDHIGNDYYVLWWIPAEMTVDGLNRVEFRPDNPDGTWGVEDIGIFDTGYFLGNKDNPNVNGPLHSSGFELRLLGDQEKILEINNWNCGTSFYLNGEYLGQSPTAPDSAWGDWYQLYLPSGALSSGNNKLYINRELSSYCHLNGNQTDWQVTLNALRGSDASLGYFGGAANTTLNDATYLVPHKVEYGDFNLVFYDVEQPNEVEISLNGVSQGFAQSTAPMEWGIINTIALTADQLNVVKFDNTYNPSGSYIWGVRASYNLSVWYKDADNDGYTTGETLIQDTQPSGYRPLNEIVNPALLDCDDADSNIHSATIWYADTDSDGYGDDQSTLTQCADPGAGYVTQGGDCNDGDPNISFAPTWYADTDSDGYGDDQSALTQCADPGAGYVTQGGDCDDTNDEINPATTWYQDVDGDGYSSGATQGPLCSRPTDYYLASELTATSGDCVDTNDEINPATTWYQDVDGDGYSSGATQGPLCSRPTDYYLASELTATSGDCVDTNDEINPTTTWYQDVDGDGYSSGATQGPLCSRPTDYYLASELTALSGDCDDNNDQIMLVYWYRDADGDGYSDGDFLVQCTQPTNYYLASTLIATSGDCEDDPAMEPDAFYINPETIWYKDADGDGYSNGEMAGPLCGQPVGFRLAQYITYFNGDYDDTDANAFAFPTIAASRYFSLALKADGTVWAWGLNDFGQLGDGTTLRKYSPLQISGLSGVVQIAAGDYHSMALRADGTVWSWGGNFYGQLGDNTNNDHYTPIEVPGLSGAVQISAGDYHSLAVLDDGSVAVWGRNNLGQLGIGDGPDQPAPVVLQGISNVVQVSGGAFYSLAVDASGNAWAWGYNQYGKLGDGTTNNHSTPVQLSGLSDVVQVSAGYWHSLAVDANGNAWAWGWNNYCQLGDGTSTTHYSPVQISGLSGAVQIEAGTYHSLAVDASGNAWAWGLNIDGQLGIGGGDGYPFPVQILGINNIIQVSAGEKHSLAVEANGTAWAWGDNYAGELGDGTTIDSNVPIGILLPSP